MPTITVTGQAEVAVPPDEASVALSVDALGPTPADAYAEAAERARALVGVLDELKIEPERRSTSGIWVDEEPEPNSEGRRPSEYRAGERVTVRVAPAAVGPLLDAAVSRAQASVQGPHWIVAPENPARRDALTAAAEDARARAEALAAGLALRVVAVSEASEGGPGYSPVRAASFAPFGGGMPVEGGQSTVASAVSVTFEVEPT
jgi:uncharacterized protein YggE